VTDAQIPPEEAAESILCLMLAQPENVPEMNMLVMKKMLKSGCIPVIVTVNKPCRVLAKMYAKEGISPDAYYVIDAVTQYSGGECIPGPKIKYVTNPSNITDLGIAITELLRQMPAGKKCIMFDSVSMLLIHIPSVTASKFLHFVVNKLKLSDVSGVLLCAEKGLDPLILSQMSSFVDHITDYEKAGTSLCIL
jgi:hypothetical protein